MIQQDYPANVGYLRRTRCDCGAYITDSQAQHCAYCEQRIISMIRRGMSYAAATLSVRCSR